MEKILSKFTFLVTNVEVAEFIDRLGLLEQAAYNIKETPEKKAEEVFSHPEYAVLYEHVFNGAVSVEDVKDKIHDLKQALAELPVIGLTLAIEPTQKTLESLGTWFAESLGRKVVFDLRIDPSIVGGVVIMSDGKYKDYSIKSKIDRLIEDSRK